MNNKQIVNNIKKIRNIYNLTQKELSEKISVGRSTISLLESGRSNPTNQLIHNISLVFGVNEKWLRTGEGPMKKKKEEIIEEALHRIDNTEEAEKAFLNVMKQIYEGNDQQKANFYQMIHSLLFAYQNGDRDTQGYLTIQLKKTFSEYIGD